MNCVNIFVCVHNKYCALINTLRFLYFFLSRTEYYHIYMVSHNAGRKQVESVGEQGAQGDVHTWERK